MNAPDEIVYEEYDGKLFVHYADHQSALDTIARLQAILAETQDAVAIRQHALELRTAENERLQARLDAGPSVAQARKWANWVASWSVLRDEILETANRMEDAENGK